MKRSLITLGLLCGSLITMNALSNECLLPLDNTKLVKICPGSGSSCILWGLVYKGNSSSHVESSK